MKKLPVRLLLMLAGIALLAGATHKQLLALFRDEDAAFLLPEGQPHIQVPEGGIQSDAFSLRLFHEALKAGSGNVCISPSAMARLLRQLHAISGGQTRHLLEQQLAATLREPENSAVQLQTFTRLFVDNSLAEQPGEAADLAMRVPLRDRLPHAMAHINLYASEQTAGFAAHMLDGQSISEETQLIALSAAHFSQAWLRPFHALGFRDDNDFFNADGSIRPTRMMACSDALVAAKAADGSWEAVALFFRSEGRGGAPACLVAILPAPGTDARSFARELTPEKLSGIRRELALTPPRELTVVMPQLQLETAAFDLQPLLLRLGLGKLFTGTADYGRLCSPSPKLGPVLGKYGFSLDCQGGAIGTDGAAGETLLFNRPFIWFIGDLTTANPPSFMGLMEKG